MFAQVGDRITVDGTSTADGRRVGTVIAVRHDDGAPPYEVRWLDDGRKSLIFPGEEARIERGDSTGSNSADSDVPADANRA
ncbi:hypothetical protein GCM10010435_42170 [Winogradskya consettensis]|uniref:DUF1918 domain-containing protein n=1 Tax=Winogradskya consettensis TaxID=113560 RepID=A0A919SPP8_9ACTN|nr:DUF1918 domain-containing protein [Actinoplanes consettensis]GIM76710.1 hypothetical protein Aco04nite_51710 [Actinoplanes consettensis]